MGEERSIYNEVENLIATRFSKENSDGRIHILENHLTVIQDGAVVSFPVGDYEKYNMIGLISVSASAQSILERRLKDSTRKRLTDTIELIEKQQRVNSEEAETVVRHIGIPLLNIVNNDETPPTLEIEKWTRGIIYGENLVKHPERL